MKEYFVTYVGGVKYFDNYSDAVIFFRGKQGCNANLFHWMWNTDFNFRRQVWRNISANPEIALSDND